MIREYDGVLGKFQYDDAEFELELSDNFLRYVGDGSDVHLPEGCTSCYSMFSGWTGKTLDLTNFNTAEVKNFSEMFDNCRNLETIKGIESLNVSKGERFNCMFCGVKSITTLDLSSWDMRNALDVAAMFWNCTGLTQLDVSGWDLISCQDISLFVNGCCNLRVLNVSNWNAPEVKIATKFACSCPNLEELDLASWNCSSLENVDGMLANCISLRGPELDTWGLSEYAISRMYTNTADTEEMTIF